MTPEFPDTRWGSATNRLRPMGIALSATRPGSWLIRVLTPADREVLRRSGGRLTLLGPLGLPTMLLTTTGRRSGQQRTTPLLYDRRADGSLVVVGSNFGQDHHPAWTANLLAHPEATVTIGGVAVPAVARLLAGAEAEAAYARLARSIPTYAAYRNRTDRAIRVFVLSAIDRPGHSGSPE